MADPDALEAAAERFETGMVSLRDVLNAASALRLVAAIQRGDEGLVEAVRMAIFRAIPDAEQGVCRVARNAEELSAAIDGIIEEGNQVARAALSAIATKGGGDA